MNSRNMDSRRNRRDEDEEGNFIYGNDFQDKFVRHQFIRNVYSIILGQLLVTLCTICLFSFVNEARMFAWEYYWITYICMFLMAAFWLGLICCSQVLRSYPCNVISIVFLTVVLSLTCGMITAHYRTDTVLIALVLTTIVVTALTLFAMQTTCDFTTCNALMLVACILLLVVGICAIFIRNRIMRIVYCALGTLVLSLYIIYDTQLIMGDRENAYDTDEYVFAALSLYANIVQLFLYILGLTDELS